MSFNSGTSTKVGIALYGSYSQLWIDDIALFKVEDGVKYVSDNMRGNISPAFDGIDYNGCDDADSLIPDPTFSNGTSADYWAGANGFANGTLSIVDNAYEYGTSLKYTESYKPVGLYTIKWIDVEPNTNYTFAVDVKILKDGAGKLALMDGKIRNNVNFLEISYSQEDYGTDWFTLMITFNSDVYDTIGLGFCDLGGEALIDNIRLFENADGKEVTDDYVEPPVADGWVKVDGKWTYYENGKQVKAKWIKDGSWYYIDANGFMVANKWVKDSKGWCYLTNSGAMATNQWIKDSVGWCYVDGTGYCVTNKWVKDSKGWCYLDANGRMATNKWVNDGKGWAYVDKNGYSVTNKWMKDSKGWCYLGSNGYMVTKQWVKDSKGWCYVDANGYMATNKWVKDSKGWCFVGADGYCVTNTWKKDSKGWCYLDANGRMVTSNWVKDNGKWYYMDANGYMLANTTATIGGKKYSFNASGVWVG